MGNPARPQPGVRFLYVPARDLVEMRTFYTDLLGLHEIFHSTDEGMLAYDCGGLQFTVLESADADPAPDRWAKQPGWRGETMPMTSWSVVLTADGYRRAVDRLRGSGAPRLHDVPVWVGYWSFPVRDPMGTTVELSLPVDDPAFTAWSTFTATVPHPTEESS